MDKKKSAIDHSSFECGVVSPNDSDYFISSSRGSFIKRKSGLFRQKSYECRGHQTDLSTGEKVSTPSPLGRAPNRPAPIPRLSASANSNRIRNKRDFDREKPLSRRAMSQPGSRIVRSSGSKRRSRTNNLPSTAQIDSSTAQPSSLIAQSNPLVDVSLLPVSSKGSDSSVALVPSVVHDLTTNSYEHIGVVSHQSRFSPVPTGNLTVPIAHHSALLTADPYPIDWKTVSFQLHEPLGKNARRASIRGLSFVVKIFDLQMSYNQTEKEAAEKEIGVAINLNHPQVVSHFGFQRSVDEKFIYLFMPLFSCSLRALLNDQQNKYQKPYSGQLLLNFSEQIVAGLAYLHQPKIPGLPGQIIHRDLKSENILVDVGRPSDTGGPGNVYGLDDGQSTIDFHLRISDFGEAILIPHEDIYSPPNSRRNSTIDVSEYQVLLQPNVGTVEFNAPEIIKKVSTPQSKIYDQKVDIWSFGMVIYEMLSNELPFRNEGLNPTEIRDRIQSGRIPDVRFLDLNHTLYHDLIQLYYECTQMVPEKRPSACQILRNINLIQTSKK